MQKFLSERMDNIPLSGIREIFEKAQSIPDVIRLEFGEPDFDTPSYIKDAACKALSEGATKYTSSYGIPPLRSAIAKKSNNENKIACSSSNVVVVVGATSALTLSMLVCTNPGDEVLIPNPGWANYVPIVRISGAVPVGYPLFEKNDFRLDPDDLRKSLTKKTKAILLNSPNNPTGGVIDKSSLKEIAEFAIEHDLLILSDEVYEKFLYDGEQHVSIASFPEVRDRVITINAFSKTYSMTGWRIGYVVAPDYIAEAIGRLNGSVSSCVASMTQVAGLAALNGSQSAVSEMVAAFERRRNTFLEGLQEIKQVSCRPPKGAFYLFVNIRKTGQSSMDLAMKILTEGRVATVPGSAFGSNGEGYLRIAYANSEEKLKEAISRIKRVLSN